MAMQYFIIYLNRNWSDHSLVDIQVFPIFHYCKEWCREHPVPNSDDFSKYSDTSEHVWKGGTEKSQRKALSPSKRKLEDYSPPTMGWCWGTSDCEHRTPCHLKRPLTSPQAFTHSLKSPGTFRAHAASAASTVLEPGSSGQRRQVRQHGSSRELGARTAGVSPEKETVRSHYFLKEIVMNLWRKLGIHNWGRTRTRDCGYYYGSVFLPPLWCDQ